MGEYSFLITLGVIAVIVIIIGSVIRVRQAKKTRKRGGKDKFYKDGKGQYVDRDGEVWEDDDLYSMKEGKARDYRGVEKEKKDDGKRESWDDY